MDSGIYSALLLEMAALFLLEFGKIFHYVPSSNDMCLRIFTPCIRTHGSVAILAVCNGRNTLLHV